MSDFKQIIDNISNIENLDNYTILQILEKFQKIIDKYTINRSGLSHIYNVDFQPIENGLTYANGEVDILGTLKFTIEDNVVVEKPATIKLNIKGDSYIVVDSDETGNALVIREDDDLYHKIEDISKLSNPNILINGNFQVNQRGQSTYTGANKYFVDRWKFQESNVVYDVATKTITNNRSGTGYVQHPIENLDMYLGKNVTLTIKVDGVVYSGVIQMPEQRPTASSQIGSRITFDGGRIYMQYFTATKTFNLVMGVLTGRSINVEFVKLEQGDMSTPNMPRTYAEELLLCMRYYQIRSNTYTIETSAIDRPIPMRVDGTIGTTTINDVTYNYVDSEIY